MLIAQQINDFITAHGKPICDGCICTGLKLTALAHSAQITTALHDVRFQPDAGRMLGLP